MTDFDDIVLSCSRLDEFSMVFNTVRRSLPYESGQHLVRILKNYFARYGVEGAYKRMNDRTVAQVFSEFDEEEVKPIASGEVDGVRYALYDAPSPPATGAEGEPKR